MSQVTFNGRLDLDGGEACTCGFEYGLTSSLGTTVTCVGTYNTGDSFSETITIPALVLYYFRSFATNSSGTTYGATLFFGVAPLVTTLAATETTTVKPVLHGRLDNSYGAVSQCRFHYGPSPLMGIYTPLISGLVDGDSFSATINVTPGIKYYYEAEAVSPAGVGKGGVLSFISTGTLPLPISSTAKVQTLAPTNVSTRPMLNGRVEDSLGHIGIVYFEYGVGGGYTMKTSPQSNKSTGDTFNATVVLAEGRAYHYRAVMEILGVTVYGDDVAINTPSSLGPVTFAPGDLFPGEY